VSSAKCGMSNIRSRNSALRTFRLFVVILQTSLFGAFVCAAQNAKPETQTPKLSNPVDLAGQPVDPLHGATNRAEVFIFLGCECPISNRYAPEIRRLQAKFSPKGIQFWLVYPNGDESAKMIRQHTNDYQLRCNVLRDPNHALVKRAKASVTPEAAVFVPGRASVPASRLAYHGRIDNRYVVLGKERPAATEHDLDRVLQAVVDAKPVPYSSKPAVGCYIAEP
jgi:hypothetical protein